jgi:hypothetical protein
MKKLFLPLFACLFFDFALAADPPSSKEESVDVSKSCAIKKAENFIVEKNPRFDKTNRKPTIEDDGKNWKFYYTSAGLMIGGGGPVVIIDKKTCEVVKVYYEQ